MLSIFSIPYGNFELDPKINKGLTLRAPFGVPLGQKGTPGGRPKVKYSISLSRFFNNIQKYTYGANFNRIRLAIKDLPLSPLPDTLRGKG